MLWRLQDSANHAKKLLLTRVFSMVRLGQQVRAVLARYQALVVEPLFYELMTTTSDMKQKAFSKLPREAGAFSLIPNVGTLLRYELEKRVPCARLEDCSIKGEHVFHEGLRDGTYLPEGQVLTDLKEWEIQTDAATQIFLSWCQYVHQFFPELSGIHMRDFRSAIVTARNEVANNHERVRKIYVQIRENDLITEVIPFELLDTEWISFRFVQCHLLAALRIFGRYQGKIQRTPNLLRKAEHSMHDLEYVIAASLVGAIATNDREVEEDFRLLCPRGVVIRPGLDGAACVGENVVG
jgi:hypothetical protein